MRWPTWPRQPEKRRAGGEGASQQGRSDASFLSLGPGSQKLLGEFGEVLQSSSSIRRRTQFLRRWPRAASSVTPCLVSVTPSQVRPPGRPAPVVSGATPPASVRPPSTSMRQSGRHGRGCPKLRSADRRWCLRQQPRAHLGGQQQMNLNFLGHAGHGLSCRRVRHCGR